MVEMKQVPDPQTDGNPILEFELTKINREEPDAALFYPPSGYAIDPGH